MSFIKRTGGVTRDTQIPVYVTRKDADGRTVTVSVGQPWFVFMLLAGQLALALWTGIAVVEAVAHIVGWF